MTTENVAFAYNVLNWKTNPLDFVRTEYHWTNEGSEWATDRDLNGVLHYATTSAVNTHGFELYPNVGVYQDVPDSQNFNFWVLYTDTSNNDNRFRYQKCDDTFVYTSQRTRVNTGVTVGGYSYTLARWDGFKEDDDCVRQVYVDSTRFGTSGGKTRILFLVYTDENLSYIDTETEAYDYINELNGLAPASFIQIVRPLEGETSPTNNVDFALNYWNIDNYEKVGFRVIQQDNYFATTYLEFDALDGQNGISTTTFLEQGAYFHQAYLKNATTTIYSSELYTFYVIENPYPTGTTTPVDTSFDCDDLGTIAGAFCGVLVKLFKPSPASIARFQQLRTLIQNKPPFGYFTNLKGSFDDLGASTTPAFVLQQITPITDNIFEPMKTGLSWILWIFFGFYAIRRIATYNL